MATAYGPERAVEASPSLDGVSCRLALPDVGDNTATLGSTHSTLQPSPRTHPPPPNPPFVFPAKPSPSSAPSSYSRATGRRPRATVESQDGLSLEPEHSTSQSRSPPLPDFTFNPGASLPLDNNALLSPPLSPQSPRLLASPARPGGHGHKRGGSEFVGGSIRGGDPIQVMSSSPTKSESGFASPTFQLSPVGPPAGRRGRHAHRRSAAVSSHDLSIILQPTNANSMRGSSAPTSPADFDRKEGTMLIIPDRPLKPVESEPILKKPGTPQPADDDAQRSGNSTPQARPIPRARVGFSETVEFIPRPLSLVSSDTSSTMTARPSHSVSGSISSIVSASTPFTAERDPRILATPSPTRDISDSRPSTAGAVLDRAQPKDLQDSEPSPRRRNSIPTIINDPEASSEASEPSPTKVPKRWMFFGLEPFNPSNAQNRSRPVSSSSEESTGVDESPASSCEHVSDSALDTAPPAQSYSKRIGKKITRKKKVRRWADSLLSGKPKPRAKKMKCVRAPVSPADTTEDDENPTNENAPAPEPMFVVPTVIEPLDSPSLASDSEAQPKPKEPTDYPMIDLDAALGPFNTPLPDNPEWDAAQRAAGHSKRQMHSAQVRKGFSGPGMHYHRRAESAPEMVPFEGGRFGIHRFGSSSTMADVFEEDEEDEGSDKSPTESATDQSNVTPQPVEATGTAALSITGDHAMPDAAPSQGSLRRMGSGLSDSDRGQVASIRSDHSASSVKDEVIREEGDILFRTTNIFQNSPSTSAAPSPRRVLAGRDLAPVDVSPLQLPTLSHAPVSPYSMSHSSAFPSPRSPVSYDAQRISTAPSSVNDENNFESLLMGEPGPEVRISVDDIPSLTSSNTTMTRESWVPNPHLGQPSLDKRPVSVSSSAFASSAFGRRRSSLASLTRLISSSHGERSKLSMEVTCDEPDRKSKTSKTKRISRIMQFWKAKEST